MTRAHRSSLTAWGPLPTCVVAPLTPINLRAADAASDDGLVLPLRHGKLPSLFCANEDWNTRYHPRHPYCVMTMNVPGCRTPAVSRASSRSEARAKAVGVGFRVEPVVAHPAPPQTRTCAINAYGSSGARVSALLWRITVLPCMAVRCCGRSWVWAGHTSLAASETSP